MQRRSAQGSKQPGATDAALEEPVPASSPTGRRECHAMSSSGVLDRLINSFDGCPYGAAAGRTHKVTQRRALYTPEERARRDATPWTLVQGILAPVQFVVFLVSLGLVFSYLLTGQGLFAAEVSIVVKTLTLYLIMVTGCIWEQRVFGKYLFAQSFYWEDVFSMLVLALHTAYLVALFGEYGDPLFRMWLALAAYAAYVINATQFVLKLRAARLEAPSRTRQAA